MPDASGFVPYDAPSLCVYHQLHYNPLMSTKEASNFGVLWSVQMSLESEDAIYTNFATIKCPYDKAIHNLNVLSDKNYHHV